MLPRSGSFSWRGNQPETTNIGRFFPRAFKTRTAARHAAVGVRPFDIKIFITGVSLDVSDDDTHRRAETEEGCIAERTGVDRRGNHPWLAGEDIGPVVEIETEIRLAAVRHPIHSKYGAELGPFRLGEAENRVHIAQPEFVAALGEPFLKLAGRRIEPATRGRVQEEMAAEAVDPVEAVGVVDIEANGPGRGLLAQLLNIRWPEESS